MIQRKPVLGNIWCPLYARMMDIQDCRQSFCIHRHKDLGNAGIMCDRDDDKNESGEPR